MNSNQKLQRLKSLLGIGDTTQDATLNVYLDFVRDEILNWMYSLYSEIPEDVFDIPSKYEQVQIMSCVVGYNGRGGENETNHSENGITRSFKYSDAIEYIHTHVMVVAKVG